MKRIIATVFALLVIGIVGYELYDRYYMSRDLRRSLLAICDSHTTWADEQQYIREARLQVKTARDHEVFDSFQSAITDMYQYSHCSEDFTSTLDKINLQTENLHMRYEANLIGTRGVNTGSKSIRLQIDQAKETLDQCQSHAQEAQTSFQKVRDRYGLKN